MIIGPSGQLYHPVTGIPVYTPGVTPAPVVYPPGAVIAAPPDIVGIPTGPGYPQAPAMTRIPRDIIPTHAPMQPGDDPTVTYQAGIGAIIPLALWFIRLGPQIAAWAARSGMAVGAAIAFLRANALRIAMGSGLVAAGAWLSDVLNLDQDEGMRVALEMSAEKAKPKHRRYSIGSNPRVRTLQKVARHTMKLLKRHQKYIKEFFPKTSPRGQLAARERAHHRIIREAVD